MAEVSLSCLPHPEHRGDEPGETVMPRTQAELQRRWAEKKMRDQKWQEIARRYQTGETAMRLSFIYQESYH